jgi:hypothetical protein
MDDGDAGALRVADRREADRLAANLDRSVVIGQDAAQDAHQGGLAGAVLPQQRVHLARMKRQIDAEKDGHAVEALGDRAGLQGRLLRGRGLGPRASHALMPAIGRRHAS